MTARNRAIPSVYNANSKMLRKLAVHAQANTFLRDMRAQFATFAVRISQTETLECIVRRAAKYIKHAARAAYWLSRDFRAC